MASQDDNFPDVALAPNGSAPTAFIMHHTAGRGDPASVVKYWQQQGRGYGAQYIMDRNGVIHDTRKEFGYDGTNEILNGTGVGKGLNNGNVVGMEIVANNDADVTPAQAQSAARFIQTSYPSVPVFGHGQVNAGHKEPTEGMTALNAINALRGGGFQNVENAYSGATASNAPINPGLAVNSSPLAGSHEQFVTDYAKSIGLDPNLAVGIANAEGMKAWSAKNPNAASTVDIENGKPFSFGDFQLNIRNGLGNMALAKGIDPRDPSQWQAADRFAMDQMKSGGLGPWKNDSFAEAYLKSGAPLPAPGAQARPVTPTPASAYPPGTTINSSPIAGAAPTDAQKNKLQKDLGNLDKALGGSSGDGDQGPPKAPPMGPAPIARNVSPLGGAMLPMSQQLSQQLTGYTPQPYGQAIDPTSNPVQRFASAAPTAAPQPIGTTLSGLQSGALGLSPYEMQLLMGQSYSGDSGYG